MIGSTIGKYRFTAQLGRGGMGTVYKAVDETLDREVAIKMLNVDSLTGESLQRFRGEAVTLARLHHPRIAMIHELAREGDQFLMVMEYIAGETCEKLLTRSGQLPISRAVVLCDQILDALEHAHTAGIVHRDLKPSNVMVTGSGDIKVMDFGIARVAGTEHLTTDGFMMGTPAYMAPEQVRGEEVDQRMDLYAVAVMLFRMLTERLPFEADSPIALIHAQLTNAPTPPRQYRADLPDWLDQVLARGLSKAATDRFQTAAEFRMALERGRAGTLGRLAQPLAGEGSEAAIGPTETPTERRLPVMDVHATPKTAPAPTPPAGPQADDTVTLRTQHVMAAAAVLALLVTGLGGVLAYVAFRRPSAPVTATAAPVSAAPDATPAAAPEVPPVATAEPEPPTPAVPPPVVPAASAPVIAAPTPAAPETKKSPPEAKKPVSATKPPSPPASPERSTVAAVAPLPSAAPPAVEASVRTEANVPAPKSSALPESFGDIKILLPDGARTRELDALLSLESDKAVLRNRDNGVVLQTLPYQSIAVATYARAKSPRWKEDATLAPIPKGFGGSSFFLKTSKHWLTLQSKSEFLVLRLEDKNVRTVLLSLESRTGSKVQQAADTDK